MRIKGGIAWVLLIGALSRALPAATPSVDAERFAKHVVVAQEGQAADVGREVLRRGGNAVDAAVATAFALAVTLPEAGNLGGGGFLEAADLVDLVVPRRRPDDLRIEIRVRDGDAVLRWPVGREDIVPDVIGKILGALDDVVGIEINVGVGRRLGGERNDLRLHHLGPPM